MGSSESKFIHESYLAIHQGKDKKLEKLLGKRKSGTGAGTGGANASDSGLNFQNSEGQTLLLLASLYNNQPMVKMLIDHGVDVNIPDRSGMTALQHAVNHGNLDLSTLLVKHGAEINVKNPDGDSNPLIIAINQENERLIELLLEAGADVNTVDKNGSSSLHKACSQGNEELVKMLLEKGADINLRDGNGTTPILLAKKENHINLTKHLCEHFCKTNNVRLPSAMAKGSALGGRILEGSSERSDDTKLCKVCWENAADCVLLWCGHIAVCLFLFTVSSTLSNLLSNRGEGDQDFPFLKREGKAFGRKKGGEEGRKERERKRKEDQERVQKWDEER
eukprot:TRINITY_DN4206_c0_g2_i1.p1 TRINITY_DN4206_c0_g2~~TRINITY_DN4206_c0_g2_i1.p1  ORF type:complete len:335 (-),score=77.75 TRINITY_DN4206_c0_g2_i1:323-1327(-)